MNLIKHFEWELEEFGRGRVAIAVDTETMVFTLAQIGGNAPPAALHAWGNALNSIVIGGVPAQAVAAQLHGERGKWRYAVLRHDGMSGAVDYRLIIEKNPALADYPTVASLHISMAGKLNGGVKLRLGDWEPLQAAWANDQDGEGLSEYTMSPFDALVIREVPTRPDTVNWLTASPWAGDTPLVF